MAGILDEDDDISIDDLFADELKKTGEEEKEDDNDSEKERAKAEKEQYAKEMADMKAELAELKSQRFAGFSHQREEAAPTNTPAPLKQRIKEALEKNYDIAEAINMAAEEAYAAGQKVTRSQYIPIAAQSARFSVAKFLDENPMTASVRKEFDAIFNTATDEELANLNPKQLALAIEGAADVAEGRVIRKTKNTRGAEPPMYSTGGGSFGRESATSSKPKLTKAQVAERRQIAEMAASGGLTKKEVEEMLGEVGL